MLVVQHVFRTKRTNLHEKYDYPGMLVVPNPGEVARAEQLIRDTFVVSQRRPPDPHRTHKAPNAFPFDDLRLYVKLRPDPAFPVFRSTQESAEAGRGVTQFGRVLYELNIDSWCANSSQAKGRVERANLTLQDRLVKELRLHGISSQKAANAYAPRFVADFNRRFAKPPKSKFDSHRPVRDDEDLDLIFTWRVPRKVSMSLTLQYDRVRYLLPDTLEARKLIHHYLDVFEYPDGRIELCADGLILEHVRYDKLPFIDAGAIIENKRLGHALKVAQLIQAQRDDRRCGNMPSRTNSGAKPRLTHADIGKKRPSKFTLDDMNAAVRKQAA